MNNPSRDAIITLQDLSADERRRVARYGSWRRFHRGPRASGAPLLKALPNYENAVLVAGCQRSGTTVVTRIIAGSRGFHRLALSSDDELDAALILAGQVSVPESSRYCFQTTYLNECYPEYRSLGKGQRLIWVLREPYGVVRSMMHNWSSFALNELYVACGAQPACQRERARNARLPWPFGASRSDRAWSAYAGKAAQIKEIAEWLPGRLLVIDYADLLASPSETLSRVFDFIDEPYLQEYASSVSDRPPRRKTNREDPGPEDHIVRVARQVYDDVKVLNLTSGFA